MSVCVYSCMSVCASVHDNVKNCESVNLKLEKYCSLYGNISDEFDNVLCDQGQGKGATLKFFSFYYNTKWLSFGRRYKVVIKYVC